MDGVPDTHARSLRGRPRDTTFDTAVPSPKSLRHANPWWTLALWIASTLVFGPLSAYSMEPGAGRCRVPTNEPCIETPSEYKEYWDAHQVGCVDPSLYVTVPWGYDDTSGGTTGDTHLYPPEFALAWPMAAGIWRSIWNCAASMRMIPLKRAWASAPTSGSHPHQEQQPGCCGQPDLNLRVQTGSLQPDVQGFDLGPTQLRVPSFETWFHLLKKALDLQFDRLSQKNVVLHYSNIPSFKRVPIRKQKDVFTFLQKSPAASKPRLEEQSRVSPDGRLTRLQRELFTRPRSGGQRQVGPGGPTTQVCFETLGIATKDLAMLQLFAVSWNSARMPMR